MAHAATSPARLTLVTQDGSDSSYFPVKNNFSVGRDSQCSLRILDSSVDELHCSLDWFNSSPYITNHTSSGKLKVNGKNVNGQVILKNKDHIKVGDSVTFRIDVDSPPSLLHDLVSPPRLSKPSLRKSTQNQRLFSLTKAPKPIKPQALTPVRRQLFADTHATCSTGDEATLTDDESNEEDEEDEHDEMTTPKIERKQPLPPLRLSLRSHDASRVSQASKKLPI